jgi:hypothetical protein
VLVGLGIVFIAVVFFLLLLSSLRTRGRLCLRGTRCQALGKGKTRNPEIILTLICSLQLLRGVCPIVLLPILLVVVVILPVLSALTPAIAFRTVAPVTVRLSPRRGVWRRRVGGLGSMTGCGRQQRCVVVLVVVVAVYLLHVRPGSRGKCVELRVAEGIRSVGRVTGSIEEEVVIG